MIHRDLKLPGKNILVRHNASTGGLESVVIDFSAAQICEGPQGDDGRALETVSFGNMLAFLCFGVRVRRRAL